MASEARWSRRLAIGLYALAAGGLLALGLWADGRLPHAFLATWVLAVGMLLAAAAGAAWVGFPNPASRISSPPVADAPAVTSPAPAKAPEDAVPRVLRLHRGGHRFIFAAQPGRERELALAIEAAARDGWIDYYEAAWLCAQLPGAEL